MISMLCTFCSRQYFYCCLQFDDQQYCARKIAPRNVMVNNFRRWQPNSVEISETLLECLEYAGNFQRVLIKCFIDSGVSEL